MSINENKKETKFICFWFNNFLWKVFLTKIYQEPESQQSCRILSPGEARSNNE